MLNDDGNTMADEKQGNNFGGKELILELPMDLNFLRLITGFKDLLWLIMINWDLN